MVVTQSQKVCFLFPGQGSQSIGMGEELANQYPAARIAYQEAEDTLGIKVSDLSWKGPQDKINDTEFTQPALLVHSVAVLRVLNNHFEIKPDFVAGHSLGEISSLVAANAISFTSALLLVRSRGILMKQAGKLKPGSMAAIIGMDIPTLEEICALSSTPSEIVQVANDNCPGQVVISGEKNALARAINLAQENNVRKVVPLAVSIAAHSPLMEVIKADFRDAVSNSRITDAAIPVISNVTAKPLIEAEELKNDLVQQLTSRVKWTGSMQNLINYGVTQFYEIGSGNVLSGLLKRIDRQVKCSPLGNPNDLNTLKI